MLKFAEILRVLLGSLMFVKVRSCSSRLTNVLQASPVLTKVQPKLSPVLYSSRFAKVPIPSLWFEEVRGGSLRSPTVRQGSPRFARVL